MWYVAPASLDVKLESIGSANILNVLNMLEEDAIPDKCALAKAKEALWQGLDIIKKVKPVKLEHNLAKASLWAVLETLQKLDAVAQDDIIQQRNASVAFVLWPQ